MEVMVPMSPPTPDFDFFGGAGAGSAYMSAPSSPAPFGSPSRYYAYASAPTSPTRAAAFYSGWEEEAYRSPNHRDDEAAAEAFDFTAGFSGQFDRGRRPPPTLAAADELFEGGRIRPLKPPPPIPKPPVKDEEEVRDRGRASVYLSPADPSRSSRKGSRSLSPSRVGGGVGGAPDSDALVKGGGRSRKWRLRDLFLFRSASEGRATGRGGKDPLGKYFLLSDPKNSGIRSSDRSDAPAVRRAGGGGAAPPVSAHEMHYAAKRAAAAEQKKRTPLPFRRNGLFGFLHFSPATNTSGRSLARQRP